MKSVCVCEPSDRNCKKWSKGQGRNEIIYKTNEECIWYSHYGQEKNPWIKCCRNFLTCKVQ